MAQPDLTINKCFFGQKTALKVMLNSDKDCYMHVGKKTDDKWQWIKSKINSTELCEIIMVLTGKKKLFGVPHKFKGKSKHISVNRDADFVFINFKDDVKISKALSMAEQEELRILLEYIILEKNKLR